MYILTILLYIVLALAAFTTAYVVIFSLAGLLYKSRNYQTKKPYKFRKIAVFIPAYREDSVIIESATHLLKQNYPSDFYTVIVIADSLQQQTLETLSKLPIDLQTVSFDISTKAKALNQVLARLPESYDIALVLDADNLLAPDFLHQVNNAFESGWRVVQGHRVAKNVNTPVALLDAVSEEINNHLMRQGHRALGLSSGLIGSGMAFEYNLFKQLMPLIVTTGGFDKELELRILQNGIRIEYLVNALCYDEKVQTPQVFENQRTRWIAAQFKYLKRDLFSGIKSLITKGNIDYFDKAIQTVLFPRVILLGTLSVCMVISFLLKDINLIVLSSLQLVLLIGCFYMTIPAKLKKKIGWSELSQIPGLFLRFLRTFTKIKEANRRFIHTPHNSVNDTPNN